LPFVQLCACLRRNFGNDEAVGRLEIRAKIISKKAASLTTLARLIFWDYCLEKSSFTSFAANIGFKTAP